MACSYHIFNKTALAAPKADMPPADMASSDTPPVEFAPSVMLLVVGSVVVLAVTVL